MTRERIEDFREIVLPFVKKRLLETNYENLGESDAEMFAKDFDEMLNLAIKALEQESVSKESYDHEYFLRKKMEAEIDHLRRYISKLETQITLEQEPFINKPCVSSGVCEHDKNVVIDKIRTEIEQITDTMGVSYNQYVSKIDVLNILDKYRGEIEPQESENYALKEAESEG